MVKYIEMVRHLGKHRSERSLDFVEIRLLVRLAPSMEFIHYIVYVSG